MNMPSKYYIPVGTRIVVVSAGVSTILYTDLECVVSPTHNFGECYYNPGGNIVILLDNLGSIAGIVSIKDCIKIT